MTWAGRVAYMEERRGAYGVCWATLMERVHLEDLSLNGRISKYI